MCEEEEENVKQHKPQRALLRRIGRRHLQELSLRGCSDFKRYGGSRRAKSAMGNRISRDCSGFSAVRTSINIINQKGIPQYLLHTAFLLPLIHSHTRNPIFCCYSSSWLSDTPLPLLDLLDRRPLVACVCVCVDWPMSNPRGTTHRTLSSNPRNFGLCPSCAQGIRDQLETGNFIVEA